MKPYERRRAIEIQAELIEKLGGFCEHCGATSPLEFNHIYRRDWRPNRFNMYQRMLKYRREAEQFLINLLCRSCNASYRPATRSDDVLADQPF